VQCAGCGGLHDVNKTYPWSGDGSQETIWDWLDAINAEGGTGYAGHHDWRIPNVRELQSIVDYGVFNLSIEPIFGPTAASSYRSSTTVAIAVGSDVSFHSDPSFAWTVDFVSGYVLIAHKGADGFGRAGRGGPQ